jgi:D-threonate/D-erythronate kinase
MIGKLFASKTPGPIVVIADDLSGAAELAGIAFARGYSAEVQREFDAACKAEVIAVDTDSRQLAPNLAAKRVELVARAVVAARPAWIYKKVDSVLRGNVQAEIEAVRQVIGTSLAILISANPSRGRTIAGGRLLIDGVPLDRTAFRDDPEHPRTTSSVSELLGPTDRIYMPDVGDVAIVAEVAARLLPDTVTAGAADFFAALLDVRGKGQGRAEPGKQPLRIDRSALLVCGSPAAWAERESQCAAAGIPVLRLGNEAASIEGEIEQALARLGNRGVLALAIAVKECEGAADRELLSPLAALAASFHDQVALGAILAEGGSTAAAVANCLGWNRFRVVQAAPAGVGVLQPLGPQSALQFLIKPGSYAWPEEIWREFSQA